MGAHRRPARRTTTLRSARRVVGGGVLGVAAMGTLAGGTGIAQAQQTVPSMCEVYLSAGLASIAPDSDQTRVCLAGAESPSSSLGSSTTTTTTRSTSSTGSAPSRTSTTSTSQPAVLTSSGTPSTDPADQPAAPGETKSVPIG